MLGLAHARVLLSARNEGGSPFITILRGWKSLSPAKGWEEPPTLGCPSHLAVVQALRRSREVHLVGPRESFGNAPLAGVYFAPMNKHGKTSRAKVSGAL